MGLLTIGCMGQDEDICLRNYDAGVSQYIG